MDGFRVIGIFIRPMTVKVKFMLLYLDFVVARAAETHVSSRADATVCGILDSGEAR